MTRKKSMYNVPVNDCTLEIKDYENNVWPFYIDSVTSNEPFRRREYNFNNIIGGTQKLTKGAYIGLDFTVTTFVKIPPNRPDKHNSAFKKIMAKPATINSPDLGGTFKAIVTIKPERHSPSYLKLTIGIKEVPDRNSHIAGESLKVPKAHAVKVSKKQKCKKVKAKNPLTGKTETMEICDASVINDTVKNSKKKSKKSSSTKKSKSKKSKK